MGQLTYDSIVDQWNKGDHSWELLRKLGPTGDPRAVTFLSDAMMHADPQVRREACWTLIEIGKGSSEALVAALRNEDVGVCMVAAWGLGEFADAKAIKPLTDLEGDKRSLASPGGRFLQKLFRPLSGKPTDSIRAISPRTSDIEARFADHCDKTVGQIAADAVKKIRERIGA